MLYNAIIITITTCKFKWNIYIIIICFVFFVKYRPLFISCTNIILSLIFMDMLLKFIFKVSMRSIMNFLFMHPYMLIDTNLLKYLHCWTATVRAQKTLSFPQIITPISIDVKLRYIISTIGCDT